MVPGRRFVCGFDYRTGFGAVTCERKLWITGLNEARLQLYGSVGAKLLFMFCTVKARTYMHATRVKLYKTPD